MDKFIKMLLETETTVILPDFGAIVVENENTGSLTFNEYVKYNDGKLDEVIVENSNMDIQEAQNYVAKHIREIQQELDKGDEYSIFELGTFTKDKDGSIIFEGNKNFNGGEKTNNQNKSTNAVQGPSPSPDKKDKEKNALDSKKTEESKQNSNKDKKAKLEETKHKEEKEKKASKKEAEKTDKKAQAALKDKAKKADKEAKKSEKAAKNTKSEKDKPPRKKKKTGIIIALILILGAFGTGGVLIATNYDEFKEMMGWDKFEKVKTAEEVLDEDEDSEPEETEDPVENEDDQTGEIETADSDENTVDEEETSSNAENLEPEIEVEEPEVVEEPKPTPTPVQATGESGKFYLIAGTFSSKSNAESLVNELKGKGHKAEIIGFLNNMHYVSVKSFNSRQDAVNGVNSVQNDAPGAWVYKKP